MKLSNIKKLFVGAAIATFGISLVGCGGGGETDPMAGFIDYAHNGSCTLALDYKGRDFYTEGVGQFDLWMAIDGDTAHFTPKAGMSSTETVKARFYGVDTPESTGRVQEYGKQASNFTKEKLKHAAENGTIVLAGVSSAYGKPSTDANARHLCCVWINETVKDAPVDTLVNLNLWIMQEGFSSAGSVEKMPEYSDVFTDALFQAKAYKLKMYSGEKDPLFNYGDYIETDICDIMREAYLTMDEAGHQNEYDGANVRITGTVSGYSNNSLYLQKYDADEEKYYGINVFCGMTQPGPKYLVPGTVLEVCATVQESENFGFQLTGAEGHFPTVSSLAKENDVKILCTAANNTDPTTALNIFQETAASTKQMANTNDRKCVNSPVAISDTLTVNYFNQSKDGNKWTIGFKETTIDVYLTEAYAPDPSKPGATWTTREDWIDKTVRIDFGIYVWHNDTSGNTRYQVLLREAKDLVWVQK